MGVCTSAAESKTATSSTTPLAAMGVSTSAAETRATPLGIVQDRPAPHTVQPQQDKPAPRTIPPFPRSSVFFRRFGPIGDALAEALSPFSSDLVSLVASYVTHGNPALDITLQYSFKPITSADRCFAVLWHRGRFWAAFKDNVRLLSDDGKLLRILPQLAVRMMVAAPSSEVLLLVHDTYEWPRVAICNANGDHVCMAYFPVPTGLNKSWYDPSSACVLDSVGNLLLTIKDGKLRRFVILKQALDPETILALNRKSLFLNWEWWQPDVDAGENCCYGRLAVHNDEIFIGARDCVKVFDKNRRFVRQFCFQLMDHARTQFTFDAFGNLLVWSVDFARVSVYTPHGERLATLFERVWYKDRLEDCTVAAGDDGRVFVVTHVPTTTVSVLGFVP